MIFYITPYHRIRVRIGDQFTEVYEELIENSEWKQVDYGFISQPDPKMLRKIIKSYDERIKELISNKKPFQHLLDTVQVYKDKLKEALEYE